jgi:hypothetical protein
MAKKVGKNGVFVDMEKMIKKSTVKFIGTIIH